jgi:hypothetical protein
MSIVIVVRFVERDTVALHLFSEPPSIAAVCIAGGVERASDLQPPNVRRAVSSDVLFMQRKVGTTFLR